MSYENEKPAPEKHELASDDSGSVQHIDSVGRNAYAKITNPLAGIPHDALMAQAARFARAHGLEYAEFGFVQGNEEVLGVLRAVAQQVAIVQKVASAEAREAAQRVFSEPEHT